MQIIQKNESKRQEAFNKYRAKEREQNKRLNNEYKQMIDKMRKKEELRQQKEIENFQKLKRQEEDYKRKRISILNRQQEL